MKHRHTPFRHVLDQMTLDLTEAVLGAVREAARAAFVGGAPAFGPVPHFAPAASLRSASPGTDSAADPSEPEMTSDRATAAEATPANARAAGSPGRRAPSSGTRRAARVVTTRGADDFDDTIADEPSEATIIDPMSMLAALESAAVRPAEAPTRSAASTSSFLGDRDGRTSRESRNNRDESEDEAAPVSEVPAAAPASVRSGITFAPRTGEEVIRTSTGGLVLRRRRGTASPAA